MLPTTTLGAGSVTWLRSIQQMLIVIQKVYDYQVRKGNKSEISEIIMYNHVTLKNSVSSYRILMPFKLNKFVDMPGIANLRILTDNMNK